MLTNRSRFASAGMVLLTSLYLGLGSTALAQERLLESEFTVASYSGEYSVIGTYGANVARLLGRYRADGHGNLAGSARVNLPGPNGQRLVVPISFSGTFSINEDGAGTIFFTTMLPGGSTAPATLDFVVTKAKIIAGVKVITEVATMQRELSSVVGGQFVTHMSTRLPDSRRPD